MPKTKKKKPQPVCTPNVRDYVMARLAAAHASAQAFLETCDEMLGHFVEPEDDAEGLERAGGFEAGAEALGSATRSFDEAHRVWEEASDDELDPEEGEEYGDDDDDESEEEEDEGEDDE
jgi:hypothetical protein